LDKHQNFGQNSKFWTKIKILVKKLNFGQKLQYSSKNNIGQKIKYRSKNKILVNK